MLSAVLDSTAAAAESNAFGDCGVRAAVSGRILARVTARAELGQLAIDADLIVVSGRRLV